MLSACESSGLTAERILADDFPTPLDIFAFFAFATDDMMLFTIGAADRALPWTHARWTSST